MEIMVKGKVSEAVCPFLYGDRVVALSKKGGEVRPIAVGSALRRLCAKILGNRVQEKLEERFRPVQLGYGTKGGAEAGSRHSRICAKPRRGPHNNGSKTDCEDRFLKRFQYALPPDSSDISSGTNSRMLRFFLAVLS